MTKDEMIDCFKSAPMGSRHQRMLWAAHKIAHLTGATEGDTYQKLLIALIEATDQQHRRDALLRQRREGSVQFGVSACVDEGERLTNRTRPLCQLQPCWAAVGNLIGLIRTPNRAARGKSSRSRPSRFASRSLLRT